MAQVELKTNFFTPHSTAASASLSALTKLLWKYFFGFVMDSPTSANAAKCRMASGFHRFDGGEDVSFFFRLGENEFRARIHRRAMAFREVVINRDLMAGVEQFFRANRADITGAAGDKNVHADSVKNFRAGESSKAKKPPCARRRGGGLKSGGGV